MASTETLELRRLGEGVRREWEQAFSALSHSDLKSLGGDCAVWPELGALLLDASELVAALDHLASLEAALTQGFIPDLADFAESKSTDDEAPASRARLARRRMVAEKDETDPAVPARSASGGESSGAGSLFEESRWDEDLSAPWRATAGEPVKRLSDLAKLAESGGLSEWERQSANASGDEEWTPQYDVRQAEWNDRESEAVGASEVDVEGGEELPVRRLGRLPNAPLSVARRRAPVSKKRALENEWDEVSNELGGLRRAGFAREESARGYEPEFRHEDPDGRDPGGVREGPRAGDLAEIFEALAKEIERSYRRFYGA